MTGLNDDSIDSLFSEALRSLHKGVAVMEKKRESTSITKIEDIDENVPKESGVYWIETTMPPEKARRMKIARDKALAPDEEKKKPSVRSEPPKGCEFIMPATEGGSYVVYSGTEKNINERLKQHLFDQGGKDVARLGFEIDTGDYAEYEWSVSFWPIEDHVLRYAVEAAWREAFGWPILCYRR